MLLHSVSKGAEVKEGLLPVIMVYTSIGLSADVTLEAFTSWNGKKPVLTHATFFSTVDFVADVCGQLFLAVTLMNAIFWSSARLKLTLVSHLQTVLLQQRNV